MSPVLYCCPSMGVYKCNIGLTLALVLAVVTALVPRYWTLTLQPLPPLPPPPAINAVPQTAVVEDTIQKNRTLVATLVDYEVPVTIANEVADLIKPVFDVRKLRFG